MPGGLWRAGEGVCLELLSAAHFIIRTRSTPTFKASLGSGCPPRGVPRAHAPELGITPAVEGVKGQQGTRASEAPGGNCAASPCSNECRRGSCTDKPISLEFPCTGFFRKAIWILRGSRANSKASQLGQSEERKPSPLGARGPGGGSLPAPQLIRGADAGGRLTAPMVG